MTTSQLIIALSQANPIVGDIAGNLRLLRTAHGKAEAAGADLLLTTELALSGYSPDDLVEKHAFIAEIEKAAYALMADTANAPAILLSTPWMVEGHLSSAVLLLENGAITGMTRKHDLPNYGPFDEKRNFTAGPLPAPILFRGVQLGVPVCEDIWTAKVCTHLAGQGAEMLLSPNGSPYEMNKRDRRHALVAERVAETNLPLVYLNQVGGQDELVYDGGSFITNADGQIVGEMPIWQEAFMLTKWAKQNGRWSCVEATQTENAVREAEIYEALKVGLRDYVRKNGFPGIVLGMSGGVDSALAATIAADALGAANVRCVMMPSPYTSQDSLDDAADCAKRLGASYESIGIAPAMEAFDTMLKGTSGVTAENIQARVRGLTLMAISNSTGAMVLSTGNKSEMSVGYATLYGDMCGGFSVLKDVYKTMVYRLCRWRNAQGEVIPERILTKAPTAELKPNQTDQDSLPPYDVLDAILIGLIEQEKSVEDLVADGHERSTVLRIWRMLDRAEYKRRQAPPGVKITPRAFGRDRRYPITNGFTDIATKA